MNFKPSKSGKRLHVDKTGFPMPGHILCYAISYIDNNTRITSSTLTNVSIPKLQVLHMLNYYNVVLAVNMSLESHKDKTYYKEIYSHICSNNYNRKTS